MSGKEDKMPAPSLKIGPCRTALSSDTEQADLLRAIARHDSIDLSARLPDQVRLQHGPDLLHQCRVLSADLWRQVDAPALKRLVSFLACGKRPSSADLCLLKDARARAKQLRFIETIFECQHPKLGALDRLTRYMGQAQDALRCKRPIAAAARCLLLRIVLVRSQALFAWCLDGAEQPKPAQVAQHILAMTGALQTAVAAGNLTNQKFHGTRKIISRLVAFYDTLTVLRPTSENHSVDRFLSTINGMMGSLHDVMVQEKVRNRRGYRENVKPLPPAIAQRLLKLIQMFEASSSPSHIEPTLGHGQVAKLLDCRSKATYF